MFRPSTATFRVLSLILCCLAPLASEAQTAPTVLDALAASSYDARQQAARSILQDNSLSLEALAQAHGQARTPEQRHRVMDALRHHALRLVVEHEVEVIDQDSASIGLAPQALGPGALPGLKGPAILVRQTLPGFPAYAHLQPGDLIVSFQGQDLPSDLSERTFVDLIQQYRPGDTVVLGVIRGGEALEVGLALGSGRGLAMIYTQSGNEIAEPYRSRWLRLREAVATGDQQAIVGFAQRR